MREVLLNQIKCNLQSFEVQDWRIKTALKRFEGIDSKAVLLKEAALADFVQSPSYQNIVHLLLPFASYYKIDQCLKLLKELGSEFTKPQAPFQVTPQYMKERWS